MYATNASAERIMQGNGETILAVDDDKALLPAIVDLLSMIGYRLITAEDGKAAVESYRCNRPDAVLMDRNMPRMNGVDAARQIFDYDPDAKVVLLSGYDPGGYDGIDEPLLKQIQAYLTKPVQLKELSHVLSKVING